MPSAMFEAYADNLRRIRLAEFVDDQLHAQHSWRHRIPHRISESTRKDARGQLQILRMKKGRSE